MEGLILFIVVIIAAAFYFLPTIVAKINNQPNFASILVLNLFLGWSLIGWVVSLVWAVKKETARQ
ncbi:superinfection immunity protein [Oceanobacillus halophilus]|uniref:Superinfection immunity protein n=1 Tax=Oceanobacillus halophilus TaxID=930130 RepID=A0A494ZSK1_9BACI|nr:superinfection immunity protein [Oceanobacillus halophilus]RKQ28683.1 superinfection immunity protein [Oceanobacillus halophilus]